MKRVFLIILDSVGIGELPDADLYGDEGSHTLFAASQSKYFNMDKTRDFGLFNIEGVAEKFPNLIKDNFRGSIARMGEKSKGKDTTTGHWEIAGIISEDPFPTFPEGFPDEIIEKFEGVTGRKVICNLPYSGLDVIRDYGKEHVETGALIVYTSADSVFQIAAHEEIVSLEELYTYCEQAREILQGKYQVGRVIARPFIGDDSDFMRTSNRRDYSVIPSESMLDQLIDNGKDVLGIGKINDIFAGKGISESVSTVSNEDGIEKIIEHLNRDFEGLCFANLVDFDMLFGHRNDIDGYAKALRYFDEQLPRIINELKEEDILIISADHGCDPSTPSTDHSREYAPMIAYGKQIKDSVDLGTRESFADIAATILDYFEIASAVAGESFLDNIIKQIKEG